LKTLVSYYRNLRNSGTATKDELNLLGFLTHMLNNANYCEHQSDQVVSRMDLIFFVYYTQKASHKLKAIFSYLPKIRLALNNYLDFSKGPEILDLEDYNTWEQLPQ